LDMVRRQALFVLLAPAVAPLAAVAVTFEDSGSPGKVQRVLEALPGPAPLPLVVLLALAGGAVPALCLKDLGLRLGGERAPSGPGGDLGARFHGQHPAAGVLPLHGSAIPRVFLHPQAAGPLLDRGDRYPERGGKLAIARRRVGRDD